MTDASLQASRERGVVEAERLLFEHYGALNETSSPAPIFLLGAPRTGSTLLYQLMVDSFGCAYLSNLVNDCFAETPSVGLAVQRAAQGSVEISLRSAYGKVQGSLQPSEASAVMRHWCGGGHPSQLKSAIVLPAREAHLRMTAVVAEALYAGPLLIKNAWNCFRIESLARVLPRARFIWIRRDIRYASLSDLEARYATKGSPNEWNSATPANVDLLRRLPYWQQVVENQHEFRAAIGAALEALPAARSCIVWYEDLCRDPLACMNIIGRFLGLDVVGQAVRARGHERMVVPGATRLGTEDGERIAAYVQEHLSRFATQLYPVEAEAT